MATRYFKTEHQAITTAKQRAQSTYCTQLIYKAEEGFFIRSKYSSHKKPVEQPIIQVHFDGSMKRLNQEEAAK